MKHPTPTSTYQASPKDAQGSQAFQCLGIARGSWRFSSRSRGFSPPIPALQVLATALTLLLAALPAAAHDGHGEDAGTAFAAVFHHYEAVWRALADDSVAGVAGHAEGIRAAADSIADDWSAERAGMAGGGDAGEAAEFFGEVADAAVLLSTTSDLAGAREAFYEVSLPLVRLNELLAGERMKVVYCAMAKKSWLQRDGKIANPYHGRSMAGCGEVVGGEEPAHSR